MKHIDKTDEVVKQQTDQASTYIDDSVSSIIKEKLNSEVVEEAGYSISVKVGVPEVPALPKSETEDKP
ncbi:14786_t:CDS:2, partial [Dentiscutata erythropus]